MTVGGVTKQKFIWAPLVAMLLAAGQSRVARAQDDPDRVAEMRHAAVDFDQSGDYLQARLLYCKAADAGEPMAMKKIADHYLTGEGIAQDYAQALIWYRKAAAAGNAEAMMRVGQMYDRGEGVDPDRDQAVIWYKKAADAGDEDAKKRLMEMGTN